MLTVAFEFISPDGVSLPVKGQAGDSLLEVAHEHNIDIEGACGGECACSTCHVILPTDLFDNLEAPDEMEEDMLDLALGLQDTSRLGCQVFLDNSFHGVKIQLPAEVHNLQ